MYNADVSESSLYIIWINYTISVIGVKPRRVAPMYNYVQDEPHK